MSLSPLALLIATSLAASPEPADAALLSPIFAGFNTCVEHWQGQLASLGDALGTDCHVQEMQTVADRTWLRSHRGDGLLNTDWYGWHEPVLSPADGVVTRVNANSTPTLPA